MITPAQIKTKALRQWDSGRFLSAWLQHHALFPLDIVFPKVSSRRALEDFTAVQEGLRTLRERSKTDTAPGYSVEFKEVAHRHLGAQKLPQRIYFETQDDFLACIGKTRQFDQVRNDANRVLTAFPQLKTRLIEKPLIILNNHGNWVRLIAVCRYFLDHPRPDCYLRQLDIPNVDTKFIEQNKGILKELLDRLLPSKAIDDHCTGFAEHGFERRYGLRYDQPLIRFRLLDKRLSSLAALDDCSIPLKAFAALNPPCQQIFITENKINGLSFPPMDSALVIFGLGYGISSLSGIEWLQPKTIVYWGDIDTHGFAILSQLRGYFPKAHSLLMDERTIRAFQSLWVQEPAAKRCTRDLPHLTSEEQALYNALRNNALGENIRLEQERIGYRHVVERLIDFQGRCGAAPTDRHAISDLSDKPPR